MSEQRDIERALRELRAALPRAIRRLVELADHDDPATARWAIQVILERCLGKPVEPIVMRQLDGANGANGGGFRALPHPERLRLLRQTLEAEEAQGEANGGPGPPLDS